MRIAIAKEGGFVSQHFGHCEGFEVFSIDNNKIVGREYLVNPGHRPGFLPVYLAEKNINAVVAGGMGATAQELFKNSGIRVIVGVQGSIENAMQLFMDGKLVSTESVCSEHQHEGNCNG